MITITTKNGNYNYIITKRDKKYIYDLNNFLRLEIFLLRLINILLRLENILLT